MDWTTGLTFDLKFSPIILVCVQGEESVTVMYSSSTLFHGLIATADFVCTTFVYKLLSYAYNVMEQVGAMVCIW